jgi:hypothetical protein
MIAESLLLALSLSALPAEASTSETAPLTGRLVRFIGEQLSFDPIECVPFRWDLEYERRYEAHVEEDLEGDACRKDDLQYRARYRVIRSLGGEVGDSVDFLASAWTSYYAHSRYALLYVLESPDGSVLPPGVAFSVYPTADGDWASCDADVDSELLEFAGNPVFGRTGGMSPHGIAQRYPSSDFVIVGEEVYCIRGRRAETLAKELEYELDQLRNQGFPGLPAADADPAR